MQAPPPNPNSNSDLNSDPNSDHFPTNLGTSQSSPLVRIADALNGIKADSKDFKVISAQNTEILENHTITLTTHSTCFAALYETNNKQNLEINQLKESNSTLKESNSTLVQNLLDQTLRITQLEKTIEALINTTEKLTSRNQILQTSVDDLMTLKQQVETQSEQIETLYNEPPNQACAPGLQECRVYKIPTYRKLNFAAFVTGVFQFSVQEFVKILLWVSDSII